MRKGFRNLSQFIADCDIRHHLMPLTLLCAYVLAVGMTGCTRTVYTPVESVHTEYRDRDVEKLVADTVRDTRVVFVKGDTVRDWRIREHINTVAVHDTCLIEHIDTIRVPYPVEKQLTRWQQTKIDYGGEAMIALVIVVIAAVMWLIKKFRK